MSSESTSFFPNPVGCILWSETGLCSGRGRCVSTLTANLTFIDQPNVEFSKCLCDPGWQGSGDWINMSDHDCSYPTLGFFICFSIEIMANSIVFLLIVLKLVQLFCSVYKLPESKKHTHKRVAWSTIFNRLLQTRLVQFGLLSLIRPIFALIFLYLRIFGEGYYLGTSLVATVIMVISILGYWMNNTYYIHCWINASAHYARIRGSEELLSRFRFRLFISSTVMGVSCLVWLGFTAMATPYRNHVFTFLFWNCLTVAAWAQWYAIVPAGQPIVAQLVEIQAELRQDYKNERNRTIFVLTKIMQSFRNTCVQAIITGILFGYWPWLRGYTVFVMGIHSVAMVSLSFITIYFIQPPPDLNCEEDVIETQLESPETLPETPSLGSPKTKKLEEEPADKAEIELLRVSASSPSGGPHSRRTTTPDSLTRSKVLEDSPLCIEGEELNAVTEE